MQINLDHIKDAERIFIGGEEFDEERKRFILHLDTIDLLAVPGSGKTTALIAKLYCITKQLPIKNNSGILVLSHTNKAVDEIEKQLKPICPQLFEYPNFVGTIQAFTNHFVSNQACYELYGNYIRKNDDEFYFYEVEKFYKSLVWSKKGSTNPNLKNKLFGLINRGNNESDFNIKENNVIDFLKNCHFNLDERKIQYGKQTKLMYGGATENYYLELEKWKIGLLSQGILSYKDSFHIAKRYLKQSNSVSLKNILQNRFKCVFVDEMQDLDQDQIDLIENIFFTKNTSTIIQRIGDKNQSIFSNVKSASINVIWKTRSEIDPDGFPENLTFNNSHRLTSTIAKLVDGFVLNRDEGYKVIGVSKNKDLAPYLIVYNNENEGEKLKQKFIDLIKKYQLDTDPKNIKRGFNIIGWTTDKEESSNKWHLRKLFPEYSKESKQRKEDFDCLPKYLYLFDKEKKTLESIRKSLLNGITRVLRIEQVYFEPEKKKHFRKSTLIKLIKEKGDDYYESFNQKLFKWCFSIVTKENYKEIFDEYQCFIKKELDDIVPEFKIEKSKEFICDHFDFNTIQSPAVFEENKTDCNLEIKLSSIHAVKGQTHCATMYVETEYFNFETSKLVVEVKKATKKTEAIFGNNPLFFQEQNFSQLNKVRSNETLKMMYVGFSRPTHLLCFAVLKENVKDNLEKFKKAGWKIIEIQ